MPSGPRVGAAPARTPPDSWGRREVGRATSRALLPPTRGPGFPSSCTKDARAPLRARVLTAIRFPRKEFRQFNFDNTREQDKGKHKKNTKNKNKTRADVELKRSYNPHDSLKYGDQMGEREENETCFIFHQSKNATSSEILSRRSSYRSNTRTPIIFPTFPMPISITDSLTSGEDEDKEEEEVVAGGGGQAKERKEESKVATTRLEDYFQDPPSHIKPQALEALRTSFQLQCEKGLLKNPVVHVSFTYPRNVSECLNCGRSDFLFVYVGLCNIFILQFVVVIIMFFSEKDIDFSDFDSYYSGTSYYN